MKKHLTLLMLILIGCQKDYFGDRHPTENSLSIDEARAYFEKNYNKTSLRKNDLVEHEMAVLWEKAYNKKIGIGEAVAVPVNLEDAVWEIGDGNTLPFKDVNYLLMYKDDKREIQTEWVQLLPDDNFLYGDQKLYTGSILVKNWLGDVLKVFKYDPDGKIHERCIKPLTLKNDNNRTSNYSVSVCITVKRPSCSLCPAKVTSGEPSSTNGNGSEGSGTYDTYCKTTEVYVDDPWGGITGTAGSGGLGSQNGHLSYYSGWASGGGGTGTGGGDYVPQCDPNIPPGTSVPPYALPPCNTFTPAPGGNGGWTISGDQSAEQNLFFPEGDPEALWWDIENFDWPPQALPSYASFFEAYPKNPLNSSQDMPAADVYTLIGGNIKALYDSDPIAYGNACAARVSRALNYSGVTIPYIASHTVRGADGKYYFLSASKLYSWMKKVFPNNQVNLTTSDGGHFGHQFDSKLTPKKGIFIMRPNWPGPPVPAQNGRPSRPGFGASGHCTIYTGSGCLSNHCYFNADGGVNTITLWELN